MIIINHFLFINILRGMLFISSFSSRFIMFSTSPRNPRLIPDYLRVILHNHLNRAPYNQKLQIRFYMDLVQSKYSQSMGNIRTKNFAFAGRDKLTRMPQALGFWVLKHNKPIHITRAGRLILRKGLFSDVLLHQMLKFQLPSPIHPTQAGQNRNMFNIRPFLEILRLINKLGFLTYQELMLFGMTLINYHNFNKTVLEVKNYRAKRNNLRKTRAKSLKDFFDDSVKHRISKIYSDKLNNKSFHVRETKNTSKGKFLKNTISRLRDYTDPVYRVLHNTGLISVSLGKTMTISKYKKSEVSYILNNVDRNSSYVGYSDQTSKHKKNMRRKYLKYLTNPDLPHLLDDNRNLLLKILQKNGINDKKINRLNIYQLKEVLYNVKNKKRQSILIKEQNNLINKLRTDKLGLINNIILEFDKIGKRKYADYSPALFEWNMWRAMSIIDHGYIKASFVPANNGKPLHPAAGNLPDVYCGYKNFDIATEVTLTRGHTQFDAEGESVTRHVGMLHKDSKKHKLSFGIFVAGKLDYSTIRFFYFNSIPHDRYYDEVLNVIPFNLKRFERLFKLMVMNNIGPDLFYDVHKYSIKIAVKCIQSRKDAHYWYKKVLMYLNDKLKQLIKNN